MSEINANIVVEPINLNITQTDPGITITPETIDLNIFTGGYACAQGNVNEVQYNAGGYIDGSIGLKYYNGNSTTVANILTVVGNADVGNLNSSASINGTNCNIIGNINAGNANLGNVVTANYFIGNGSLLTGIDSSQISNGNSNVKVSANSNVTVSVSGNSNIITITGTSVIIAGSLTSNNNVSFNGANISLGNVTNLEIYGGNNGQFLQTDGTGNLTWVTGTGSGNGTTGGSNTQIQYNDAGLFGGSLGFTFNKTSNLFSTPGNINVTGTVVGNVQGPIVNLAYGIENVNLLSAQSGTYNFDLISNAIRYTTSNASANVTLNMRGNSTVTANTLIGNGQSISATYVLQNGNNTFTVSGVQIDNSPQTIKWVGGSTPVSFSNAINAFTFTIIKTATTPTYTVLGSLTRYA